MAKASGSKGSGGRGGKNEVTRPDVASLAGKALRNPRSLTNKQIRSIAGSALTQAPDKPGKPTKRK